MEFKYNKEKVNDLYAPVILVWMIFLLLPFGRATELPNTIAAISAIFLLRSNQIKIKEDVYKYFSFAFLCLWLPMLISLFDAVNFERSFKTVLGFLRFWLSGLFVIWVFLKNERRNIFLKLMAWLVLFWSLDALMQYLNGVNIFGYEYDGGSRLNGIFGDKLNFGLILAMLSIFPVAYAVNPFKVNKVSTLYIGAILTGFLTFLILAAGSRNSWFMFFFAMSIYWLAIYFFVSKKYKNNIAILVALGLCMVVGVYFNSNPIRERINQTLLLLNGNYDSVNSALSQRLPIWEVSLDIFKDNLFNGIGVRGLRYEYRKYAKPDDIFIQEDEGAPTHSHLAILEIATETGVVGIIGYLILIYLLLKWWHKKHDNQVFYLIGVILLLRAISPINNHWAIYSSNWGQLYIIFIAMFFVFIREWDHESRL